MTGWTLRAALLGSLVTASGCLLPRAPRPAPALPLGAVLERELAAEAASPSDAPADPAALAEDGAWPTSPQGLRELQALARARNPAVEEWAARVAAAEARTRQARSLYFPRLRSDGQFLALEEEVSFSDGMGGSIIVQDQSEYTQRTSVSYTLVDWGQRDALHQSGLQEEAGERARATRRLQGVDLQVARAFFGVFEARRDLDIARASVEELSGALKLARDLVAVGRATDADVLVVEASLERRRFQARQLADLADDLEENLARLLDLPVDVALPLADPGAAEPLVDLDADPEEEAGRWTGVAIASRAELAELAARHESLAQLWRAGAGSHLPSLDVFLEHEYSTTESVFRDPNLFSGGFRVAWEIFSGGRRAAVMDEYEALASEVRAGHRALVADIWVEVRSALRALRRARDGVEVADRIVEQTSANLERVRDQFEAGRATGQELLEAESLLRTEEARRNRAAFGVHQAIARLRFVCGLDPDDTVDAQLLETETP